MGSDLCEKDVLEALGQVQDPGFREDIVSLGFVQNIKTRDSEVALDMVLPTPVFSAQEKVRDEAERALKGLPGVSSVQINLKVEIPGQPDSNKTSIPGVKNIVAIGSGKGGVGKSTVTANLSMVLARSGVRVGLLDGDIYGPTIPIMLGASPENLVQEEGRIIPAESNGVKFMSMGFMARGDKPLIWRGPMAHNAFQQSLMNVKWGDLDYLLIDMPPGTGDVHLTLVQSVSVVGAVIVSTPQDVGFTISMKTYRMFEQTKVHILGIVENMSYHTCSHCGKREEIFGHGMVSRECEKLKVPFLGEIPLDRSIREYADRGVPVTVAEPDSTSSEAYMQIAERMTTQIALRHRHYKPVQIVDEPEDKSQKFSV